MAAPLLWFRPFSFASLACLLEEIPDIVLNLELTAVAGARSDDLPFRMPGSCPPSSPESQNHTSYCTDPGEQVTTFSPSCLSSKA